MRALSLFCVVGLMASAYGGQAAAASAAPEPIEVVKLEQNLWTTMAEAGFAQVRQLFTHDFIQVGGHIEALDNLLIPLKHCKIESFELRDLQTRILSNDSAMTAYHVVSTMQCDGGEKPETKNIDNNSMTIWVRKPGSQRWLVQAHTETPAKP